ncbi:MAG: tripartite tricarboxylate transporter TctB family protein [Deltaproteobacteria bacterium]|nr:tripartite tricarboxylate transporter TctB family protein [Deltaproteobacteria bacterium]
MENKRVGSLLFLAIGIYGLIFSTQIPMGRWAEPGPGIFPLALSVLLCLSGILGWIGAGKGAKEEERVRWADFIGKGATPLRITVLTAAFIVVLDRAGYLATSFLYLFLLFFWVSRYSWWKALGLAILLGAGGWVFFDRVLGIALPRLGIWFF